VVKEESGDSDTTEMSEADLEVLYIPVLRIHDILGWIRIRGSMDPCL
jgi:hypothetical protein